MRIINVMIVEDDPMVAELNKQYVERIDGFSLRGIATNTDEANHILEKADIDLMLLDVYMPGLNGIEFLRRTREQRQDIDVILITAASEMNQIQQSIRLGAIDYLIKPFEFERFQEALSQYRSHYDKLHNKSRINQTELDRLFRKESDSSQDPSMTQSLPKGLTKNTLQTINRAILSKETDTFSTEEIAEAADISRVSVRKYLKFLSEIEYLEENLVYGVGRPIYQYKLKKSNVDHINLYL